MKKIFKILFILVVVLILAIIFVPMIFKGKINEIVKEQANANLNAKLEFKDLSLSLIRSFPDLSVRIDELSLSGVGKFEKDTLVKFNYFQTDLSLTSLIFGDAVEVEAITLNNPSIRAIVLEDGRTSWDIAKKDTTTTKEIETDDSKNTKEKSSLKISLKKFEINKAQILFDDRKSNMQAIIDNFNFLLRGDLSASEITLKLKTSIEALNVAMNNTTYLKKAKLTFKSDILANMDLMSFSFKENEFGLNEILLAFEGNVKMPGDDIAMDVKFNTTKTAFKSILSLVPALYMADFKDIKTSGKFDLSGHLSGVYNKDNLPAFGVKLNVENGMFHYPGLPKSVDNINVKVKLENKGGTGKNNTIDLEKAHLEIAKNPIDAKMYVVSDAKDVDVKGNLSAKLDLETVADAIPGLLVKGLLDANLALDGKLSAIEKGTYNQFKADGGLNLTNFKYEGSALPKPVTVPSMQVAFTPSFVNLKNCDVNIGNSDLHLAGKIDNILPYLFKDSTIKARFDFNSNNLDMSDLVSAKGSDKVVAKKDEASDTTALEAFDIPSNIDFLLNSKMKKIKYDKLLITDLEGDILLKDSKAMFRAVKMNLLDGNMVMNGSYDAKIAKEPRVDFNLDIKNFDIPKSFETFNTVKELVPIAEHANGKVSLNFDFESNLSHNLQPKYETLNGKGQFKSQKIRINNSKSLSKLADLTKWKKLEQPTLKDVDLKFKIENGNINVDPTKMKVELRQIV